MPDMRAGTWGLLGSSLKGDRGSPGPMSRLEDGIWVRSIDPTCFHAIQEAGKTPGPGRGITGMHGMGLAALGFGFLASFFSTSLIKKKWIRF